MYIGAEDQGNKAGLLWAKINREQIYKQTHQLVKVITAKQLNLLVSLALRVARTEILQTHQQ